MQISCSQDSLAQGLSIVGRAVQPRSTLPVLGNVLLASDQSRLKLAATNLEIGITCWLNAEVEDEGSITIPARLLGEFVSSLPKERIDLKLNGRTSTVNLKCASYEANIKGIDAEEFPPIPQVAEVAAAAVDPKALHSAIEQVVFAAATDDTRPALSGVLASFQDGFLTLAAADGFRLAVRRLPVQRPPETPFDVIVPAKSLQELARVLVDQEEPVELSVTPNRNQVLFRLKDVELISRLIEGNFPNYRQIIPTSHLTRVLINTRELQGAARIGSYFARDASNILRLHITPGEELTPGRIMVAAGATDVGDATAGIDAIVEGQPSQIAFNVKYMSDVLAVIDTNQISLEITSPSRPGVIKPVGDDDYLHVIMPMHVTK